MLVGRSQVSAIVALLSKKSNLALDTETTGLRPYHGDRLFSIIINDGEKSYYFNFQKYSNIPRDRVLNDKYLALLHPLFSDPAKTWYIHNAKFDMAILAQAGITLVGTIHCTQVGARIEYNNHFTYNLDDCGTRIGFPKDDAVSDYITKNKLFTKVQLPGKKTEVTLKHFDQVPWEIMVPYGERDATVGFKLGKHQEKVIEETRNEKVRSLPDIWEVEKRLTKTIFDMESRGLRVNFEYCQRAAEYELGRASRASDQFREITGREFVKSSKLFAEIFIGEKDKWHYTKEGNPSFTKKVLPFFEHPAAKAVVEYSDAKSKADFYNGFIYHADYEGIVHPHLNQGGTGTGRLSSSDPNFQNLKKDKGDDLNQEFVVRRAIIPREGYTFLLPDYDQMEYRLMLDMAAKMIGRKTPLIDRILGGEDVHQATADMVRELTGLTITRDQAKQANFATLYGSGAATLSKTMGCSVEEAYAIRAAINRAAPEINLFIKRVSRTAKRRGFVFNWMGRRSYFPVSRFCYRGPNSVIQGGCADVMKIAMNKIHEFLLPLKSKMLLQVHDELNIEAWCTELEMVAKKVHEIMERVYPYTYLPLTCGMEWSKISMADKTKGFPPST